MRYANRSQNKESFAIFEIITIHLFNFIWLLLAAVHSELTFFSTSIFRHALVRIVFQSPVEVSLSFTSMIE